MKNRVETAINKQYGKIMFIFNSFYWELMYGVIMHNDNNDRITEVQVKSIISSTWLLNEKV